MEMDFVKLRNFRQYVNQKVIFARPKGNRNFTVILGANGAGKTNLLNAITWCLYGEELHIHKKYAGLPIVNTTTFKNLKIGETCDVEVQIQLEEKGSQKALITRTLRILKTREGRPHKASSELVMMRQRRRDWVKVTGPQGIINRMIPKNLEEYFFFDGERLDRYFREETGETIKNAVFRISQLGLLERAVQHLATRRDQFLRSSKGLSSEAEKIRETLSIQRRSLEVDLEDLKKLETDKAEAEKKESKFSANLRKISAERVSALESQRSELEKDIERLEDEILRTETDKFEFLLEFSPIIYMYEPLARTNEIISSREEAGDIPPEFKKPFVEKLLAKGRCICGNDISEGSFHRRHVVDLLQECSEVSEISDELIRLNANIELMLSRLEGFRKKQIEFGKRHNQLQNELRLKVRRIKDITDQIEECDIEQVKTWESKRQEWKKVKEELFGQIGVKKHQIERRENIIRANEIALKQELRKEGKYKELLRILNFCETSLEAADAIKIAIMEDVRKEIEEVTKKQFFDLIWKRETYIDVGIDARYNISVLHQSGMEAIGTLSAGERQVLALSFMAALNRVSGFDVPLIIDTPLGRISKEPKKAIARNLPKYLKGKQVTLLVTEEEYTSEVRTLLSDRVGINYVIEFKETEEGNLAEIVKS